jgi:hypothetical protein
MRKGSDQAAPAVKFSAPTITNGMVFVGGEYAPTVYGALVAVVGPPIIPPITHPRQMPGFPGALAGGVASIEIGLPPLTRHGSLVIAINAAGDPAVSNTAAAQTQASPLLGPNPFAVPFTRRAMAGGSLGSQQTPAQVATPPGDQLAVTVPTSRRKPGQRASAAVDDLARSLLD